MQTTFLDSLMIADREKIHNQMLSWILNLDEPKLFDNIGFLKKLFYLKESDLLIGPIEASTEINRVDLKVKASNVLFYFENKLKSSEHNFQTERYKQTIEKNKSIGKVKIYYGFITLIKEVAKDKNWISISFEELKDALSVSLVQNTQKEFYFISEYIQTLDNLVSSHNYFIENHKNCQNVFTDGSKRKSEKKALTNEYHQYISKNQLETIFQKSFLKIICQETGIEYSEIGETRGVAYIQFDLMRFNINTDTYCVGFQFQGATFKINLSHSDYSNSILEQMPNELILLFKEHFLNQFNYFRFNKAKSKAYISVSKRFTERKEIYHLERVELAEILSKELEIIQQRLPHFKSKISLKYNLSNKSISNLQ